MIKPYYKSDSIVIYNADCLLLLPELIERGLKVDHVITDPPYEAEAHTLQRQIKTKGGGKVYGKVGMKPLDFTPITEEDRSKVGLLISSITQRWCLTFCQVEASQKWADALSQMNYKRTCVWVKPDAQPQLSGDRPAMGHESIVAMHSKKTRSKWNGGGRSSVFIHNRNQGRHSNTHLTTKPMSLMLELVRLFTDPGDLILDPYCGSGTTLRAAQSLGRRAIGIEINEKYAELSARRCEAGSDIFRDSTKQADALAERGYGALI